MDFVHLITFIISHWWGSWCVKECMKEIGKTIKREYPQHGLWVLFSPNVTFNIMLFIIGSFPVLRVLDEIKEVKYARPIVGFCFVYCMICELIFSIIR